MAVESRRRPFSYPQHLLPNRDLMNTMEQNCGFCSDQTTYGATLPLAAEDTSLLHLYGSVDPTTTDVITPQLVKSVAVSSSYYDDINKNNNGGYSNILSGFCSLPSRKRSRDFITNHPVLHQNSRSCSSLSFLRKDISLQIHQQQLEIDRLIALHMERVKMEMEEKRKKQVRTVMEAVEKEVMKKLRAKEEEGEKMGKLNNALEERVKSLAIENQIWRDLAQTHEATANALRINLEQVLAQVKERRIPSARKDLAYADDDDAQSYCGSREEEEEVGRWRLAGEAQDKGRMCRNCGEEESCVLLLPCRHLCLCGACGSILHTCPVCRSPKNVSVHVNMSS